MEIRRLEDRCNLCMRCVRDCAPGIWRDVDGAPTPVAVEVCNLCSHCLAVCPKNAIEHSGLDATQVRRKKKKLIDPESYRETVLTRRSVRQFKDKGIEREVIEDIIDMARYSPTGSNKQNVEYTVVTDRKLMRDASERIFGMARKISGLLNKRAGKRFMKAIENTEMGKTLFQYSSVFDYYVSQWEKGRDYIFHGAPVLLLLRAPKVDFACDNCNIAATNITNYAHTLGLGSVFIGYMVFAMRFDRTLRKWFRIPRDRKVYAVLAMGHPAYSHASTASRKKPSISWMAGPDEG